MHTGGKMGADIAAYSLPWSCGKRSSRRSGPSIVDPKLDLGRVPFPAASFQQAPNTTDLYLRKLMTQGHGLLCFCEG